MSGVADAAVAALLGGCLGLGLWSLLAALPQWRAQPLIRRVAPYIRDVTDPRGTSIPAVAPTDPAALILGGARRLWRGGVAAGARLWGTSAALTSRLRRAGWSLSASAFRERQLAIVLGAAFAGAVLAVVARVAGNPNGGVFVLPVIFAVLGGVACELWLTRAVKARQAQIDEELPTVLEFLALCLSAGEGLFDAIKRTSHVGVGELSAELRTVVLHVGTGTSLADALVDFGARVDVAGVRRVVDHLVAAIERGAPLAAVLKDQASDARDEHKRALMERAGKNEVTMLIPLVFLILPLSVVIAIFPGIAMLGVGFN